MEKVYRNYSMGQTKIKPIKIYLTTVHINTGKREMEKTYSPPEKLAKKKKKLALKEYAVLKCPEVNHQALKEDDK